MPPLIAPKDTLLLAFNLPQFHPIPENDAWWGAGFTEWTNVSRGRPLFRGHYQPHLPADLGFYDLRVPETRAHQATLAREAGLTGFIYFHYWFNGRRLLDTPVNEILRLKQPDYPFCLCWANEPWSRNWDGQNQAVLMPQLYSPEDDLCHIEWLLQAFSDERYIKIDGRPLFLIYRPSQLPDIRGTVARWREAAERRGFPGLFLGAVRAFPEEFSDPAGFELDASVEFRPNGIDCGDRLRSDDPLDIGYRLHRVWDYSQMVSSALALPIPDYPFFPGVCPSWDNSVRRSAGGVIFREATPEKYGTWLREVLMRETLRSQQPSIVVVNAWNEWAEGNHLEPCQRWGHGYLAATREAIDRARSHRDGVAKLRQRQVVAVDPEFRLLGNVDERSSASGRLLLRGWCVEAESLVPPEILLFAVRQEDGRFILLSPVKHQRLARTDVVQALGAPQVLTSGWAGQVPLSDDHADPTRIQVLAFRTRDGAAACLPG